jgi:hypothetical protein
LRAPARCLSPPSQVFAKTNGPLRSLGAPREPQERFVSVNRCPSQDETTNGGNDSAAARALLYADYLSTVREDRQGCLGRKPSAGYKAGLFRLSHWPRRGQGREPDGILRCLQYTLRFLDADQWLSRPLRGSCCEQNPLTKQVEAGTTMHLRFCQGSCHCLWPIRSQLGVPYRDTSMLRRSASQ